MLCAPATLSLPVFEQANLSPVTRPLRVQLALLERSTPVPRVAGPFSSSLSLLIVTSSEKLPLIAPLAQYLLPRSVPSTPAYLFTAKHFSQPDTLLLFLVASLFGHCLCHPHEWTAP